MSREYTQEEIKKMFLEHIRSLISYWINESRTPDLQGKMNGLAFSILSFLDGESLVAPKFIVCPDPHEDDKEYNKAQGNNWYPQVTENVVDIAGSLHDGFYK